METSAAGAVLGVPLALKPSLEGWKLDNPHVEKWLQSALETFLRGMETRR